MSDPINPLLTKIERTMTYQALDQILPMLGTDGLPDPCPIRVVIGDRYVKLYIGPRDWQWDVITTRLIGAGVLCAGPTGETLS